MKRLVFFATLTLLSIFAGSSRLLAIGWNIIDMGSGDGLMYGIAAGNGRNDGVTRIYGANANARVYEFTYSGGTWNRTDMGKGTYNMMCVTVGDGENNGKMRVYSGDSNGNVLEFTFSGTSWQSPVTITTLPQQVNSIAIGKGENDSVNRIYCACSDDHLYELSYNAGVWNKVDMGSGGNTMSSVTLGNGRNDGITRIYGANVDDHIYEFTYTGGTTWSKADLGSGSANMASVAVGNGRNDGVTRVYGGNGDGHVYEFSNVSASSWTITDMGSGVTSPTVYTMQSVLIENGQNDGVMRVYAADQDSRIYELTYTGSAWNMYDMSYADSASYMQGIASGNGRNDGVNRIFGASRDDHMYEFTHTTSTLITDNFSNNTLGNAIVYPTFANLSRGDKIKFANFTPSAKIIIISPAGDVIKTLQADSIGTVPAWDGTVDNGGKAASGTYIVHASNTKDEKKIFKILLIK